jgi:hypothetical protein
MAALDPSEIIRLRAEAAAARAAIHHNGAALAHTLDVPTRVRQELTQHPLKWGAVALAGGLIAGKLLPVALKLVSRQASRQLTGTLLATVAPLALKAGVAALQARSLTPPPPPPAP